jgi:hypothetical protein
MARKSKRIKLNDIENLSTDENIRLLEKVGMNYPIAEDIKNETQSCLMNSGT